MGFKCGIVGLPNVGKSTLFNALTASKKAQAENFPFCTIDPNIGVVLVPDERLKKISIISKSLKTLVQQLHLLILLVSSKEHPKAKDWEINFFLMLGKLIPLFT